MAHPDDIAVFNAFQKAVRAVQIDMGPAVLPLVRSLDLTLINLGYQLDPIADTEDRRTKTEYSRVARGSIRLGDAPGPPERIIPRGFKDLNFSTSVLYGNISQ